MFIKSDNCSINCMEIINLVKYPMYCYVHAKDRDNDYLLKLQKETVIKENKINNFFTFLINFTSDRENIEIILGETLSRLIIFYRNNEIIISKSEEEVIKFKDKHKDVLNMMLAAILEAKLLDSANEDHS